MTYKIILSLNHYDLVVGKDVKDNRNIYQIIHREYDVIEVETTLLLQGYRLIRELDKAVELEGEGLDISKLLDGLRG